MCRSLRIAAIWLAVLAAAAAQTACAATVLDRLFSFTFRVEKPVRKNTGSSDLLDAAKIKAALRTATPEEGGFVDRVVALARAGKIPPALVESTFDWARKKPYPHRFQYFKRGLTLRAAKAGITL
jgi:hypothetical protein